MEGCRGVGVMGRLRGELAHHGRGAGEEEMTEIQVVIGETTLILHIETSLAVAENNSVCKAEMLTVYFAK